MGLGREGLEADYKLANIRKAKRTLLIVQLVVVALAMVVLAWFNDMIQLKPFFIDVATFFYMIIFVWLLMMLESFFFCYLEMKYTKSGSSKYFMLKNSHRTCIIVMVVWIVAALVFVTPYLGDRASNLTSESGHANAGAAVQFYNMDQGGFTAVDHVTVRTDRASVNGIHAFIVKAEDYEAYESHIGTRSSYDLEWLKSRALIGTENVTVTTRDIDVPFPDMGKEYGAYYLVLDDTSISYDYTVHRAMDKGITSFIMIFAFLFLAALGSWIILTLSIKNKFAASAIYK